MKQLLLQYSIRLQVLLLVAFCTLFCWVLISVVFVSMHPLEENYWMAGPDDDFARLWQSVKEIHATDDASRPQVVLVGSSALRESIVTPEYLEQQNALVDWHLLTPGDLLTVEALQVVSSLPKDMSGVLFVEVSMRTLSTSLSVTKRVVARPRFPEQPLTFQAALWREGLPVGSGLGVISFYAARLQLSDPLQVPINDWLFHQVDYMDTSHVNWEHLEQKHFESLQNIEENVSVNLRLYQRILHLAPPKMKVVWISSPRNREWESTLNAGQHPDVYVNALSQLEEWSSHPVVVLDSDLRRQDYLDHGHIVTAIGRRTSTDRLLQSVEELSGGLR